MRKPEEIRKEIEALNKELEAIKVHESRQVAAVNILYNLGWTHDPHKGWQKPAPKLSDYKAQLKVGKVTKKTTLEPDWKLTTQCNCPWDRPCVCPDRA
ncbi:hypothetical protein Adeo_26 [Klebsiella phage Adeo]|uniref:Uncharacterized protein n=1 Tax=Klebsiella phage Adeo TaxID=3110550 RepID=A0ABZ1A0G0_9CAUD|nr:hypothetical protein Adeo_26 [Klebsiella phage Adeo]